MQNHIKPANMEERVHPEFNEIFLRIPKGMKPYEEEKIQETRQVVDTLLASLPRHPDDNLNVSTRNIRRTRNFC